MVIVNHKKFEIGVHISRGILRRIRMYWKPQWSIHNDNYFKVENGVGFKYLNCWSYFLPGTIQLFWTCFIFYIKLKPERISGERPMKYVKFEDTHLNLMDLPEGSWSDK